MRKFGAAFIIVFLITPITRTSAQDHSDFIEGPFETPQEITEACLMCHDEVGENVLQTRHWKWQGDTFFKPGYDSIKAGKKNLINNFCIALDDNYPRCTSCHIGYGWKDDNFDFDAAENIDCLVCHEQTGTYKKSMTGAGMPEEGIDLVAVAQSVGTPTRENCGVCHFYGGGGDGVKHGDMNSALYEPDGDLDVHMGLLGFNCIDCHTTTDHKISGASHGSIFEGTNHIYCADCHGEEVHGKEILNKHVKSIACETCHIPEFARANPTKTYWDWSTAGLELEEETDMYGKPKYNNKKGSAEWGKDVVPEYRWHNGSAIYYMPGDWINPEKLVAINILDGKISDPESKIAPFKRMISKQPYDVQNSYLIIPHMFGKEGFWSTFNWDKAAELGMEYAGLDYSGEYDFVETEMLWPINHTVAPSGSSLKCTSCHGIKGDHRLDWKALGYPEDPLKSGTRFDLNYIED